MITDMSETEARITLSGTEKPLPDYFTLLISPDGRKKQSCKLVSRFGFNVCVQFITAAQTVNLDC